jgi:hypothetical protein
LRGCEPIQKIEDCSSNYFAYPNFDTARCSAKNASTIAGLHDRYIPDLHTPTDCEVALHHFFRSQLLWDAFADNTRVNAAEALSAPWSIDASWPRALRDTATRVRDQRETIIKELGDGCHLPLSFSCLGAEVGDFDDAVGRFEKQYLDQGTNNPKEDLEDNDDLEAALKAQMGHLGSLGNWRGWIDSEGKLPDSQCCLVSGRAGTGKTQTLAEICSRYELAGGVVLFMEGRLFTSAENPWTQFLRWLDFPGGQCDFLDAFTALAASTPLPGLICIDALNETPHREVWRNHLHDFASELRPYASLKLIVTCRTDFIDSTLPPQPTSSPKWVVLEHSGLGAQVVEAAPKYLRAYNVKGYGSTPFTPEFTNPLLLKTFCEAYEKETVPSGSLSLERILRKYVERKAANIEARIGCAASVVRDALRDLAQAIAASGAQSLPEKETRDLLDSRHPAPDESRRLYPALRSEGILHELRDVDQFGERITVRFAYERIWDYVLSLHLLPSGGAVADELRSRLRDAIWRRSNPGLLSILAVRLPEGGHGELHDVAGLQAGQSYECDRAFSDSLAWRTRSNFSQRAEELHTQIARGDRIDQLIANLTLACQEDHPWNGDRLHEELSRMTLEERDDMDAKT